MNVTIEVAPRVLPPLITQGFVARAWEVCHNLADCVVVLVFLFTCVVFAQAFFEQRRPQRVPPRERIGTLFPREASPSARFRQMSAFLDGLPHGLFKDKRLAQELTPFGTVSLVQRASWTMVLFKPQQAPEAAACLAGREDLAALAVFWWPNPNQPSHDKLGLGFAEPPPPDFLPDFERAPFAAQRWVQLCADADLSEEDTHDLLPAIERTMALWLQEAGLPGTKAPMLIASTPDFGRDASCIMKPLAFQ